VKKILILEAWMLPREALKCILPNAVAPEEAYFCKPEEKWDAIILGGGLFSNVLDALEGQKAQIILCDTDEHDMAGNADYLINDLGFHHDRFTFVQRTGNPYWMLALKEAVAND